MKHLRKKQFNNGTVYALETKDGYAIEVTDTFLPIETISCDYSRNDIGSRDERWMIGVSCQSGCPVKCKFCATGKLHRWRNLTTEEILDQVRFILDKNESYDFSSALESKINYTRMGEPFLNIDAVKGAIQELSSIYPETHHYVSTVGILDSDFSWIKDNITLQISVHSLDEDRRSNLIPLGKRLMSLEELGKIRTTSKRKTTVNLTLVDKQDFDIAKLRKLFDPAYFFIKLSPINENDISIKNELGKGVIRGTNN